MSAEDDLNIAAAVTLKTGEATGNPWIVGVAVAWLVGDYLWNYFNRQDAPPPSRTLISLPTVAEGTVIPMFWGMVNIDTPVMVWISQIRLFEQVDDTWIYAMNAIYVTGTSFLRSNTRLLGIQFGGVPTKIFTDTAFQQGYGGLETLTHYALQSNESLIDPAVSPSEAKSGYAQILNGRPEQVSLLGSTPQNWIGKTLQDEGESDAHIQSYREYITIILRARDDASVPASALWGNSPNLPAVSFTILTKPQDGGLLHGSDDSEFGANPIDVLYDVLTGQFNKLGEPTSRIALSEFHAAAVTCEAEGLLYSRKIDTAMDASELVAELAAFVNGIVYEDPEDQLIHLKLLRADYNPADLQTIDPSNCVDLQNIQLTTWDDVPNKITVRYTEPSNWSQGTVSKDSQATAVGQDGLTREVILNFPGCTNRDQALVMAAREIQIRSRPIIKCIAITHRKFATLRPGDCVYVNWPRANISSLVFRVLNLTKGTLRDGKIRITLVQDVFYVWKRRLPVDVITDTADAVEIHFPP